MAPPFGDNAVLQQGIALPVWGTSLPGAGVTVSFADQTKTTTADEKGAWRVVLDPLRATRLKSVNQTPVGETMTVVSESGGRNATVTMKNLVTGEVWLCAGQSNMAGRLRTTRHYPEDTLKKAQYPALRQMAGPGEPWIVCAPETAPRFKRVAFFFARRLQRDILVPVGLVTAAVGGSRIEPWLGRSPRARGKHYDKYIAPLVGYGIRGVLWYQGESNASDGHAYLPKLRALLLGWREAWGQGDFPVYFVQLPGMGKVNDTDPAGGGGWAETRQAQFQALAIKNTGMAITIDIGDRSVHPPNKYDTGVRLARLALNKTYGFKGTCPSGPLYAGHTVERNTIRVRFDHAESGLMLAEKRGFPPPRPMPDGRLRWLAIQAKDGKWHWASGKIEGSELIVSCAEVAEPVAVRYAFTQRPVGCMLYSRDALPAAPFSTERGEEQHAEDTGRPRTP